MRVLSVALILLIISHFALLAEVVEEVVAVVGNTPILRSDITLSGLVVLLERRQGEAEPEYRSRLLDARIRLELQYRDLDESGTLFRLEIDTTAVRNALVERAGGAEPLAPRLEMSGLTWVDVDALSLRVAAAEAYAEQRLRPRVTVSLEELRRAYQDVIVDPIEAKGQTAPPLSAVQDQLRQLVVERKLNQEIESWLSAAADRYNVTRFLR